MSADYSVTESQCSGARAYRIGRIGLVFLNRSTIRKAINERRSFLTVSSNTNGDTPRTLRDDGHEIEERHINERRIDPDCRTSTSALAALTKPPNHTPTYQLGLQH